MVAQQAGEAAFAERPLRPGPRGGILGQLGFQTHQSPVAALSELVANAWDADASSVNIALPDRLGGDAEITIRDDGRGMTFEQCQDEYMNAGHDRRRGRRAAETPAGRPVMGRKGVGKFAGFGIAKRIRVETVSRETGEQTVFEMDADDLASRERVGGDWEITARTRPAAAGAAGRAAGTTITLSGLLMSRNVSRSRFSAGMAGRFLVNSVSSGFEISVNGAPVPSSMCHSGVEFAFPRDCVGGGPPRGGPQAAEEWGEEVLPDGHRIRWRFGFTRDPIGDADLQGIAVFASGRLAQKPFFFGVSGAVEGRHGKPHMFGQVVADYVDQFGTDLISAERQRINWEAAETQPLLEWGRQKTREILREWGARRAEKRAAAVEEKMSGIGGRIGRLGPHEQKRAREVLRKLAAIPAISDKKFFGLAGSMLASWESGRLRDLWEDIADRDDLPESDLLGMLAEANAATALALAEAARTKMAALRRLEKRIAERDLEGAVRGHLAENPWIISPEWEYYRKETRVSHIVESAARSASLDRDDYRGRVDLVLSSGESLLVLEFVRPGLLLDRDHLDRCARYVDHIRASIRANTGLRVKKVVGLIVADRLSRDDSLGEGIRRLESDGVRVTDWRSMLAAAAARHEEHLRILGERAPGDERLRDVSGAR